MARQDSDLTSRQEGARVFSPSELNREARVHLEAGFGHVLVEGEISNLARPRSGHIYFTLKDDKAQIRCAFFRQRQAGLKTPPTDGDRVLIKAQLSIYEPRGDYQLIVQRLQPAGEGALRQAFEALREKLKAEGLFEAERKQALPEYPQRIAVVTSATGAAVRDIIQVLGRRWPVAVIRIYPVPVQGDQAAPAIVHALEQVNRHDWADVVILGRGGGSLEDLWPFNEETVVRAVAASALPVVAAVGHETDTSIAELAADLRAPTPSAAAEAVVPDQGTVIGQLRLQSGRLHRAIQRQLEAHTQRLDYARRTLRHRHPLVRLARIRQQVESLGKRLRQRIHSFLSLQSQRLENHQHRLQQQSPSGAVERRRADTMRLHQRLIQAENRHIAAQRDRLAALIRTLQAVNPLHLLEQGYTALQNSDGQIIRQIDHTRVGETLRARLQDGQLQLQVTGKSPDADAS